MDNDDDGEILMTQEDLCSIFDPVVDTTLNLIQEVLERNNRASKESRNKETFSSTEIEKIFLVGGFSESRYLWKKAVNRFSERVEVFMPPQSESAIAKGAVYLAKFPRYAMKHSFKLLKCCTTS